MVHLLHRLYGVDAPENTGVVIRPNLHRIVRLWWGGRNCFVDSTVHKVSLCNLTFRWKYDCRPTIDCDLKVQLR